MNKECIGGLDRVESILYVLSCRLQITGFVRLIRPRERQNGAHAEQFFGDLCKRFSH